MPEIDIQQNQSLHDTFLTSIVHIQVRYAQRNKELLKYNNATYQAIYLLSN